MEFRELTIREQLRVRSDHPGPAPFVARRLFLRWTSIAITVLMILIAVLMFVDGRWSTGFTTLGLAGTSGMALWAAAMLDELRWWRREDYARLTNPDYAGLTDSEPVWHRVDHPNPINVPDHVADDRDSPWTERKGTS